MGRHTAPSGCQYYPSRWFLMASILRLEQSCSKLRYMSAVKLKGDFLRADKQRVNQHAHGEILETILIYCRTLQAIAGVCIGLLTSRQVYRTVPRIIVAT